MSGWKCLGILPPGLIVNFLSSKFCAPSCLSMSHDIIVKQHGGTIDIDTQPDSFTEFIITLPRAAMVQARAGGRN